MTKSALSLFSGCGGMDLGFRNSGWVPKLALDRDPVALDVYNRNHPSVAKKADLNEQINIDWTPDAILAGPPCQGFSTASGYKSEDIRNMLLIRCVEHVTSLKPQIAVIENVPAVSNSRNASLFKYVISILSDAGYYVQPRILKAETFGIAQKRRRLFIVARRNNKPFNFSNIGSTSNSATVHSVISGLTCSIHNHQPEDLHLNGTHRSVACKIGQGQKLCNVRAGATSVPTWDIPNVFGATTTVEKALLRTLRRLRRTKRTRKFGDADPVSMLRLSCEFGRDVDKLVNDLLEKEYLRKIEDRIDLTNTFNGKYRRLVSDGLSPTVDTRFGDFRLFLHPTEHRSLSVREAARLQGFPDTFRFDCSSTAAFRLVGNAVPPPIAQEIGEMVRCLI